MFQLGNFSKLQDSNPVFIGTNVSTGSGTTTSSLSILMVTTQIWLAGSAACDIVIAICMTFFVSRPVHHQTCHFKLPGPNLPLLPSYREKTVP